jgi:dihydroflavonol-4-reductase
MLPANLLEVESLRPLFEKPIENVFHTASLYDYSASIEVLRRINVDGTRNLLDAMEGVPITRFVHWSTCGVFGKPYTAADGHKVNLPFTEDSPSPHSTAYGEPGPAQTHLVNPYSISKWEQEQMMWDAYRNHGLPLTVVRPAPIYGPGSCYGHGGVILAIAQGFFRFLPKDADQFITSSVHVVDIARFAIFAASCEEALGEDYNVVDNSIVSYHEFLTYIALLTGRRMWSMPLVRSKHLRPFFLGAAHASAWLQKRFSLPRVRVLEVQSATYISSSYWLSNRKSQALGYTYTYPDIREGLKDTVTWMRKMGWLTQRGRLLFSGTGNSKRTS